MGIDLLLFECVGMKAGGKFPIENTGRGQDISPEFLIKNLSPAAKTLAITLEDIRHPLPPLADLEYPSRREDSRNNPWRADNSQHGKRQTGSLLWLVQIRRPQATQGPAACIPLYDVRP